MNAVICSRESSLGMWNLKIWYLFWKFRFFAILSILKQKRIFSQMFFSTHWENENSREKINENAARLMNCYGNAVLRLSYTYLHNLSDAEDVLQDTLIKYLQTAPRLENPAHEKAWLLRVAANISKNRIEYNRVRKTDELDELLAAEEDEDLSFVWAAVKELPEKYREVVHLFYYEGYPTAVIAKILVRNEKTIRSDLSRGRKKLKEILKERYDFEQVI